MTRRLAASALVVGLLLNTTVVPALAQVTPAEAAAMQERGRAEGWTFNVGLNEATQYPLSQLCGAVESPDWRTRARFDACTPQRDLPSQFTTWRWSLTGIRNQASCGSCWAFGAIGAMEAAIRLRTTWSEDLSEQWLVSCTNAGSCAGGWHTDSFEYLKCNGWQDPCGGSGAVFESSFPYVARDVPCGCPYTHPYCLDYWAAVGPQWGVPTVAEIKQAIYDHGPVAVCVYVNSAFQMYLNGVFNACEDNWINHVVVLYGWDDRQGTNGIWYLKNSWGGGWGEAGTMRIEYGCCQIGYATCYVETNWTDCNGNGIHDAIDIKLHRSQDCNYNGIPDECDIASGASLDVNGNGIPDECERLPGDVNCDGAVNFDDITPFVLALSGPSEYRTHFPACLWTNADTNGDGAVNFVDINPFVTLLAQ